MALPTFTFEGAIWIYPGKAGWHFVSVPALLAAEIRDLFGAVSRGFGSLPVQATIGQTSFKTSIFPNRQDGTYLLPIKAAVREAENLAAESRISVRIEIRV